MSGQRPPQVLVVIVNYRTPEMTIDCLASLLPERERVPGLRVSVIDGGSGDRSAELIGRAIEDRGWSDWASITAEPYNGGFAYGNNRGIEPALHSPNPPDYFHLLNPDTVIRPGAVAELVEFLEAHPEVGIVGSGLEDDDGTPRSGAFRFPSVLSELERGTRIGIMARLLEPWITTLPVQSAPRRVDWVTGASMMVRRAVFDQIGLMDDGYFLYFEETDFIHRATRAGWQCWTVPSSRVIHFAGQSTGMERKSARPKRLPGYWYASRRRYLVKNRGRLATAAADVAWVGGYCLHLLKRVLTLDFDPTHGRILADFLVYNTQLRLGKSLNPNGK